MTSSLRVLLLCLALFLAAAPPASSSTTKYALAYQTVEWTDVPDGTHFEGGSYSFEAMRIQPGSQATYSGDTTIRAAYVLIEGTLRGHTPPTPGARGPSVRIEATLGLEVRGMVLAGHGAPGAMGGWGNVTQGGAGGDGGSVVLVLGSTLLPLLIGDYALVAAGDGGAGGPARAMPGDASGPSARATGGAGGAGGSVQLQASSATFNGHLEVGDGGRGGDATAAFGDAATVAQGGRGGAPGRVSFPPGHDPVALAKAGRIVGSVGGNGGHGTAQSLSGGGVKPCLVECQNNGGSEFVEGGWGAWGQNATLPRAAGGDGNEGAPARAWGGDGGGSCVAAQAPSFVCVSRYGGLGGNAWALGGAGGPGGHGGPGDAATGSLVGGPGGAGGLGGLAEARAGQGGCPTIGQRCADPGTARAQTQGGAGGAGGSGGATDAPGEDVLADCASDGGAWCYDGTEPALLCGLSGPGGGAGPAPTPTAVSPGRPEFETRVQTAGEAGASGAPSSSACAPA